MSSPSYVITISGPSGAGKSSTVRAVAECLGTASCFHFDDYGEAMEQPDDGLAWIAAGADLAAFSLPQFGKDLELLRMGVSVVTPAGRKVESAPFLVVEEPFGRGRSDMKGLVDLCVCIDLPMEVALARRLLESAEKWSGSPEERHAWMCDYLKTYLFEGMREVYIAINDRVKQHCDLILDGMEPIMHNARKVTEVALAKRHA